MRTVSARQSLSSALSRSCIFLVSRNIMGCWSKIFSDVIHRLGWQGNICEKGSFIAYCYKRYYFHENDFMEYFQLIFMRLDSKDRVYNWTETVSSHLQEHVSFSFPPCVLCSKVYSIVHCIETLKVSVKVFHILSVLKTIWVGRWWVINSSNWGNVRLKLQTNNNQYSDQLLD